MVLIINFENHTFYVDSCSQLSPKEGFVSGRNLAPMGLMFLGDLHPEIETYALPKLPAYIDSEKVED